MSEIDIQDRVRELCRSKKEKLGFTYQDISDRINDDMHIAVPVSTVGYFFSQSSKDSSLRTAGCICFVLGVSIDSLYQPGETGNIKQRLAAMTRRCAALERELAIRKSTHLIEEASRYFRRYI